jgi:predicted TIM-barrel fold metal-dependent hydrolase
MAELPPVCDAHFHVSIFMQNARTTNHYLPVASSFATVQFWNHHTHPNPNLGGITDTIPVYDAGSFSSDKGALKLVSAVHVETMVGQMEGGAKLDTVEETRTVLAQSKALGLPVAIVGYVHLGRDDAAEVLAQHQALAGKAFVGVRMILNFDKEDPTICWPQVGRDDFVTGGVPKFADGYVCCALALSLATLKGCLSVAGLRCCKTRVSHSISTPIPSSWRALQRF